MEVCCKFAHEKGTLLSAVVFSAVPYCFPVVPITPLLIEACQATDEISETIELSQSLGKFNVDANANPIAKQATPTREEHTSARSLIFSAN